jgi:hypothetical protein
MLEFALTKIAETPVPLPRGPNDTFVTRQRHSACSASSGLHNTANPVVFTSGSFDKQSCEGAKECVVLTTQSVIGMTDSLSRVNQDAPVGIPGVDSFDAEQVHCVRYCTRTGWRIT